MNSVLSLVKPTAQEELERCKRDIADLFLYGEAIMFRIVKVFRHIEERELFKADLNPDTGAPFRSMREYTPYLLNEVRSTTGLAPVSVRTLREYLALDRVFVQNLGISPDEIIETGGVSLHSYPREAGLRPEDGGDSGRTA